MERKLSVTDDHSQDSPILIVGASVRSAANSAMRAGLRPICADCFADEDLRAVAGILPVKNYPDDLPRLVGDLPGSPWMYTGALENHPRIIAKINAQRPLWGNSAEVVEKIRDPFGLTETVRTAGLPAADLRPSSSPPATDGSWMLKPVHGSGGRGIQIWVKSAARSPTLDEPHYFQKRRAGRSLSALFVASDVDCRLVGVARQLIGNPELHAPPFAFCGAIAPIDPGPTLRKTIRQHGNLLARTYRLRGLFGIDFVCSGHELWLMEVNPRYTATVELFEHAFGSSLIKAHWQACDNTVGSTPPHSAFPVRVDRLIAKTILYAERNHVFPAAIQQFGTTPQADSPALPRIADIPAPGTRIPTGHPICTLFAAGETEGACLRTLRRRTHDMWRLLTGPSAAQ